MKKAAIFLLLSVVGNVFLGLIYIIGGVARSIVIADLAPSALIVIGIIVMIPLAWIIPMVVHINKADKYGGDMSIGFKIVVLLFGSIISGILLLCDNS